MSGIFSVTGCGMASGTPNQETWILARKPLSEGTVAENVVKWGVGGINIDATRVATSENLIGGAYAKEGEDRSDGYEGWRYKRLGGAGEFQQPSGRWPSNLVLTHSAECQYHGQKRVKSGPSTYLAGTRTGGYAGVALGSIGNPLGTPSIHHADRDGMETVESRECAEGCPVAEIDAQSGERKTTYVAPHHANNRSGEFMPSMGHPGSQGYDDNGGASRFFPTFSWSDLDRDMKPNQEIWILGRKPLSESTVVENILKWGVGALHVDACRIGDAKVTTYRFTDGAKYFGNAVEHPHEAVVQTGRWPSNLMLTHSPGCRLLGHKQVQGTGPETLVGKETVEDWACTEGCPVATMNAQSGDCPTGKIESHHKNPHPGNMGTFIMRDRAGEPRASYGDTGGASRFFPVFAYDPTLLGSAFYPVPESTPPKNSFSDVLEGNGRWAIIQADALEAIQSIPPNSLDGAVVYAPADRPRSEWMPWLEARLSALFQVLKPGAHLVLGSCSKTFHWSSLAVEDAGYEVRDVISHLYGTGGIHPPVALLRWFIKLIIPTGGVVMDILCGNGSTGVAAILENVRYLGCGGTSLAEARIRMAETHVPAQEKPQVRESQAPEPESMSLDALLGL